METQTWHNRQKSSLFISHHSLSGLQALTLISDSVTCVRTSISHEGADLFTPMTGAW
jgi:hypothetical protein